MGSAAVLFHIQERRQPARSLVVQMGTSLLERCQFMCACVCECLLVCEVLYISAVACGFVLEISTNIPFLLVCSRVPVPRAFPKCNRVSVYGITKWQ